MVRFLQVRFIKVSYNYQWLQRNKCPTLHIICSWELDDAPHEKFRQDWTMEVCMQAKVSKERFNSGSRGCRWGATIREGRILCRRGEWSAGGCASSAWSWRRIPGGIRSRGGRVPRRGCGVRCSSAGLRYVILTQSEVTLNSVYQLIVRNGSVHVRLMRRGTIWQENEWNTKQMKKRTLLWKCKNIFSLSDSKIVHSS